MRIRFALAAAALAAGLAAAPATADAQQRAQHYGYDRYDTRYDNRYDRGYRGDFRQLRYQVEEMRRDIRHFDRRGMITSREARKLDHQADRLLYRISQMGYRGVSHGEYRAAEEGVRNLQRAIRHDLRDRDNGRDDRRYRHYRGDHDDRWDRRRDRRDRWDD